MKSVIQANKLLLWLVLGMGLALGACTLNPEVTMRDEDKIKAPAGDAGNDRMNPAALPSIDAAAPMSIETATFGLG